MLLLWDVPKWLPSTCDLVGHLPIGSEVFSIDQHQVRTLLHGLLERHQLLHPMAPGFVVTGDHEGLLFHPCNKEDMGGGEVPAGSRRMLP